MAAPTGSLPAFCHETPVSRRSANYAPTSWSHFLQSLHSHDSDHATALGGSEVNNELHGRILKLEEHVAASLAADALAMLPLTVLLELVDSVQQLGLGYRFEGELKAALEWVSSKRSDVLALRDLHATALLFRLLRDGDYDVSQDIFSSFLDEYGNFDQLLCGDIKGLLSLYEASHYGYDDECILDKAKAFSGSELRAIVKKQQFNGFLDEKKVMHAIELPIRWRMPRLQTRWFISLCSCQKESIPGSLLDLAKLDFDRVQQLHQRELKEVSRWWRKIGLTKKLPFIRDRLVEVFFIVVGMLAEPQFGYVRIQMTKIFVMVSIIDDLYDIYGTMDELKLFTEALQRWDVESEMPKLPDYMKMCYLALFNQVNEVAYDALKDKGMDVLRTLKGKWTDLCQTFLQEATWYQGCYTPTLEEYIENGWMSVSYPMALPYICLLAGQAGQEEAFDLLAGNVDLVRWNAIACRLVNDMSTSTQETKRGDVAKAVECYMHHKGVSEEDARAHIQEIVDKAWKVINRERFKYREKLPKNLVDTAINLTRAIFSLYRYGDGLGFPSESNKEQVLSLLVEGISGVEFNST